MKMSTIRVEEFECQQRTMTTIEGIEANDKREIFLCKFYFLSLSLTHAIAL